MRRKTGAGTPGERQTTLDDFDDLARNGLYFNCRAIRNYEDVLGPEFSRRLRQLTPNDTWLDGGAGEAAAQLEYLQTTPNPANAIACDLNGLPQYQGEDVSRKFRFFQCSVLDLPAFRAGSIRLVTDVYGALSYLPDLSGVLRKYLTLLVRGGALIATLSFKVIRKPPDYAALFERDWINGGYTHIEYFSAIKGASAHIDLSGTDERIILIRTTEPLFVPQLEFIGGHLATPPFRSYRWPQAPKSCNPIIQVNHTFRRWHRHRVFKNYRYDPPLFR